MTGGNRSTRGGSALASLSIFQKTTIALSSPFRAYPPSSLAWRIVSQNGQTYFDVERRKRLMPRYGLLLRRLRGNPAEVHGLRQGTIPASSRLIIFWIDVDVGNLQLSWH
jgi:hypothetical protein